MRLIFIRHGQTTGDVEDRYGGAYDDNLSEEGLQQVQQLAEELAEKDIHALISSPLVRALETAAFLAKTHHLNVVQEPRIRERNQYGPLTGKTKTEAKATHPEMVESLKDRFFVAPDAESYETFEARICEAFQDIASASPHNQAIVWHGGGMRVLFRTILKLGELDSLGDCCWVELGSQPDGTWKILDSRRLNFAF